MRAGRSQRAESRWLETKIPTTHQRSEVVPVVPRSQTDPTVAINELCQALRPFVLGQVSTLPQGVLVLVSAEDLENAKQVYRACGPEAG